MLLFLTQIIVVLVVVFCLSENRLLVPFIWISFTNNCNSGPSIKDGSTALYSAVQRNHADVVKVLTSCPKLDPNLYHDVSVGCICCRLEKASHAWHCLSLRISGSVSPSLYFLSLFLPLSHAILLPCALPVLFLCFAFSGSLAVFSLSSSLCHSRFSVPPPFSLNFSLARSVISALSLSAARSLFIFLSSSSVSRFPSLAFSFYRSVSFLSFRNDSSTRGQQLERVLSLLRTNLNWTSRLMALKWNQSSVWKTYCNETNNESKWKKGRAKISLQTLRWCNFRGEDRLCMMPISGEFTVPLRLLMPWRHKSSHRFISVLSDRVGLHCPLIRREYAVQRKKDFWLEDAEGL